MYDLQAEMLLCMIVIFVGRVFGGNMQTLVVIMKT